MNFQFTKQLSKTLRLFDKASFAYIQASTCLHRLLANHPKKNMQILNYQNFYISQLYFSFPHMLDPTATIYWNKLPNTNIHISTSILPQVYINIKNSPVFPVLSKLHIFNLLLWIQFFYLTSLCMLLTYTLLCYAIYKEIANICIIV